MAIDFWVYRKGALLLPGSSSDKVELERLPPMKLMEISVSTKAPKKLPRWYRAGVQLLCEATGRWPNRELAHREIVMRAGFFDSFVISMDGDTRYTPQSTTEWDLVQWRAFVNAALPIMLEFAGDTHAQFRSRVDNFFGIKLKEAWEEE